MITPFGELPNNLAVDMTLAEQHEWLRRRITRRTALSIAAGAAVSPMLWTRRASAKALSTGVSGRHITYGPDPRTQMIVGFRSASPMSSATVSAHPIEGATAPAVSVDADIRSVRGSTALYGRAELHGLAPNTPYGYTITVDGRPVSSSYFRTSHAGAFRFTAFGDQGIGSDPAQMLAVLTSLSPKLHLLAGDLCYADSSGRGGPGDVLHSALWDVWLDQNDPVSSHVPWLVAPGNHEMEPGFSTHGYAGWLSRVAIGGNSPIAVPVASTVRCANVGFIGLDSNDVANEIPANRGWTAGRQTQWLEQTLASLRSDRDIDFVVAYLHASPYSTSEAHGSEGGIREHWVPLFDKYEVDLVISGHNHCYERTKPLRGGTVVAEGDDTVDSRLGTTYITAGGGGQELTPTFYPRTRSRVATDAGSVSENVNWSLPARIGQHGVLCADVTPGDGHRAPTMHLRSFDSSGAVVDEVTLSRKLRPNSSHELPWLIAGAASVAAVGAAATGATLLRRGRVDTPAD
jgi:hypothetical protein